MASNMLTMKLLRSKGFLEISVGRPTRVGLRHGQPYMIYVSYNGNMGARKETHVAPLFDSIYGEGSFDRFMAVKSAEVGSPDYCWHASARAADVTWIN